MLNQFPPKNVIQCKKYGNTPKNGLQSLAIKVLKKKKTFWNIIFHSFAARACSANLYHFWHVGLHRRRYYPSWILSRFIQGLGSYGCPFLRFSLTLIAARTIVLRIPCYTVIVLQGGPKTCHFTFAHIFVTDQPIFKILCAFCGQLAIKWLLNILPHVNCVTTLPCEIQMQEKLTITDGKRVGEKNTLPTKNAVNDLYDVTIC